MLKRILVLLKDQRIEKEGNFKIKSLNWGLCIVHILQSLCDADKDMIQIVRYKRVPVQIQVLDLLYLSHSFCCVCVVGGLMFLVPASLFMLQTSACSRLTQPTCLTEQ